MKLAPALITVGLAAGLAVAAPAAAFADPVDSSTSTPTTSVDANYADFPQLPTLPLHDVPVAPAAAVAAPQSSLAYTGGELPTTALWVGAGVVVLGAGLVSARLITKRAKRS